MMEKENKQKLKSTKKEKKDKTMEPTMKMNVKII